MLVRVYATSALLLVTSYFVQTYALSSGSENFLILLSIYLILIPWSVLPETVFFLSSKVSKIQGGVTGVFSYLTQTLKDPFLLLMLVIIASIYGYYSLHNSRTYEEVLIMVGLVVLTFSLRVLESKVRSLAVRIGVTDASLIIVNLFGVVKWLFILANVVYLDSEVLMYTSLSIASLVSLCVVLEVIRRSKRRADINKVVTGNGASIVLISAIIFGTLGYQLDKLYMLFFRADDPNPKYILAYSVIFLTIQGLAPIFNRFLSYLWQSSNEKQYENTIERYSKYIAIAAFLIITTNTSVAMYVGDDFLKYDIAILSVAVIVHAISHVFYFNFIAREMYQHILIQNFVSFLFGMIALIVIHHREIDHLSMAVLSTAVGQFLSGLAIYARQKKHMRKVFLDRSIMFVLLVLFVALLQNILLTIASNTLVTLVTNVVLGVLALEVLLRLYLNTTTIKQISNILKG